MNLEVDVLAKYTERLLAFAGGSSPARTGQPKLAGEAALADGAAK